MTQQGLGNQPRLPKTESTSPEVTNEPYTGYVAQIQPVFMDADTSDNDKTHQNPCQLL